MIEGFTDRLAVTVIVVDIAAVSASSTFIAVIKLKAEQEDRHPSKEGIVTLDWVADTTLYCAPKS